MDSVTLANAPREITVAGRPYTVTALELREFAAVQAWLREHATDPVVAAMQSLNRAKAAGVPVDPADRKELMEAARREAQAWPPRVGSGAWLDLLLATEGSSLPFLRAVLRKHQPDITDEELERLNREATPEESQLLIYRALGYVPAPKADAGEAATETPAPTPTTGAGSPAT